jgi:hypothetical protein
MALHTVCTENLMICPKNGEACSPSKGRVTGPTLFLLNTKVPLTAGDAVERSLPSGIVERFIVIDPGFQQGIHGIPSHYQAKYRRADAEPRKAGGHIVHVSGAHARINMDSIDRSTNTVQYLAAATEPGDLAIELRALRVELLSRAGDGPEQYSAIGAVASAESAASRGDATQGGAVLRSLGKAGEWVLSTARDLGLQVASEYIKTHIG